MTGAGVGATRRTAPNRALQTRAAGGIAPVRGSDAVDAGCLGPVVEGRMAPPALGALREIVRVGSHATARQGATRPICLAGS
jgi:hypothetical protein